MRLKIFSLIFCLFTVLEAFEINTLDEKVGQLLMPHFNGEELNGSALTLLQKAHVGGIIYFKWSNGLVSTEQVRNLSRALQNSSKIPLWISIDQEGGPVARLDKTFGYFPGQREVVQTLSLQKYLPVVEKGAETLAHLGINMNLSPVVDISTDPTTAYIAKRTYGDTPDAVVPYARNALIGYQRKHVLAVLKHFPGYGEVTLDPHFDLPINHKTLEQLSQWELQPYYRLRNFYDAVMSAHILFPLIDPQRCATLSPIFYEFLRKQIHFQGLIVTDSLVMEGVIKNAGSLEKAAIEALKAGADLLIIGGKRDMRVDEVLTLHKQLVEAVQQGEIPMQRIDEAVERNLKYKRKYLVPRCPRQLKN